MVGAKVIVDHVHVLVSASDPCPKARFDPKLLPLDEILHLFPVVVLLSKQSFLVCFRDQLRSSLDSEIIVKNLVRVNRRHPSASFFRAFLLRVLLAPFPLLINPPRMFA